MFNFFGLGDTTTDIVDTTLEVTTEIMNVVSNSEFYLRGIYAILVFFVFVLVLVALYKLFNLFF